MDPLKPYPEVLFCMLLFFGFFQFRDAQFHPYEVGNQIQITLGSNTISATATAQPGQEALRKNVSRLEDTLNRRIYIFIIFFLILVFGILVYYDIRSKTRANRNLAVINAALADQAQQLESTLEILRKSENKYRTLIQNSPTGIIFADTEGNIIEVNKRMTEILGLPENAGSLNICLFESDPLKQSGISDDIKTSISTGEMVQSSRIIPTDSGGQVHTNVIIHPLKDQKNGISGLILSFEDVTFSRKAQSIIHESEEKYRILVENSLQAMLIIQDGRVIFANARQEELTLYSFNELNKSGPKWLELLFHPDDLKRSFDNVSGALAGEQIGAKNEYRIIRKDGKTRWIEALGSLVIYQEKPALLIVAFDITGRKESELYLIEYGEKLRQANAMKDKFFSIIAHDLKNPFNAILGYSSLLNEAYGDFSEAQRREFIRHICDASESTFKLLQNLLDWSRTQTGSIECLPKKIDLQPIAVETTSVLKTSAWNKGIGITVEIPENTFGYADENMIKTILRNLLSNAIKFSSPGGKVSITATSSKDEIVVCVKDSGIGIGKKDLKRLFRIDEPFKSSGTSGEGGSGLGLILCKEFIGMNQGKIWAESTEGTGSNFYFSIPAG
jgi:PAS domain S-box-containing protein